MSCRKIKQLKQNKILSKFPKFSKIKRDTTKLNVMYLIVICYQCHRRHRHSNHKSINTHIRQHISTALYIKNSVNDSTRGFLAHGFMCVFVFLNRFLSFPFSNFPFFFIFCGLWIFNFPNFTNNKPDEGAAFMLFFGLLIFQKPSVFIHFLFSFLFFFSLRS